MQQSQTEPYDLEAALKEIETSVGRLLEFPPKYIGPEGTIISDVHWYVLAAMKKTASLAHAFCTLVRAKNTLTAAALIRLQLDSGMRVFGLSRVERLSDKYLHSELNKAYPGLSDVYENTSAFVHLSSAHIKSVLSPREGTSLLYFYLRGTDDEQQEEWVADAVDAFSQATNLAVELIEGCLEYLHARRGYERRAPFS